MGRRSADHPQRLPAHRPLRGYRRSGGLAPVAFGRAEDQPAHQDIDRESRPCASRATGGWERSFLSDGVLYVADRYETALFETIHHHARFMARTAEAPGWTSQFREIILTVCADLHDLRGQGDPFAACLDPDDYAAAQLLGAALRKAGSDGIAYPSVRQAGGECVGLLYPDCASSPVQGRHLDYHWDGKRVDLVRDAGSGAVFRVVEE